MEPTTPPPSKPKVWSGKTVAAAAVASALVTGAAVNSCETPPVVPPDTTLPGTSVPGTEPPDTFPPVTNPPTTPPDTEVPDTTTTTQPPPANTIIPAGGSVTDAIAKAKRGETLILGPGDHGNKDLANIDGKDVILKCDTNAKVRRWRYSNVKNLSVEECKITPDAGSIGVYMINGGGHVRFTGLTVTGGERGFLIQNDRAKPELWTTDVTIEDSIINKVKIDAIAVYGGRGVKVLRNNVKLDTDGCDVEHSDGFQSNALIDGLIEGNIFENNGKKSPSIVDGSETCPPGTGDPGWQHDQGIIATTQTDGLDQNTNITYKDNLIKLWYSGMPMLLDGARSTNIKVINTTIQCSIRTAPKVTGSTAQIVVTGSRYIPC